MCRHQSSIAFQLVSAVRRKYIFHNTLVNHKNTLIQSNFKKARSPRIQVIHKDFVPKKIKQLSLGSCDYIIAY